PPHLAPRAIHSFPTRRSSDLPQFIALSLLVAGFVLLPVSRPALAVGTAGTDAFGLNGANGTDGADGASADGADGGPVGGNGGIRSEEHTSELQSRSDLVCRLL